MTGLLFAMIKMFPEQKTKKGSTEVTSCQLCGGKDQNTSHLFNAEMPDGRVAVYHSKNVHKKRMKQRCGGNQNTSHLFNK